MSKFIVTKELGRLARWLRILGFDTVYYKGDNRGSLIIEALREDRIIITRNKKKIDDLGKKTIVIDSSNLLEQLNELIKKVSVFLDRNKMFTRCVLCNTVLDEVRKDVVRDNVPEYVFKTHNTFMRCSNCKKIYWEGSHWGNINKVLDSLRKE